MRILPKSRFARNVAVVSAGSAMGQGLLIVSAPLLTRLYTPADFGVLAVYVSIVSILVVVASLRYEVAINVPGHNKAVAV
jgi:O-antigen/teichoic acid export membrane protein